MGTRHTPGPWKLLAVGDGTSRMCPADAEGVSLLTIVDEEGGDFAAVYSDADARLIAAAPELLEALTEIIVTEPAVKGAVYERAKAIIAKATQP